MRIIAGEFRRQNLFAPRGLKTRPMLDRVREAIFSVLGGKFKGDRVLDLFAGSGSLGLEAISRGASHCLFIESDAAALEAIHRNVEKLGVEDRVHVMKTDALRWMDEREKFDLFFCDPPYKLLRDGGALRVKTVERFADLFRKMGSDRAQGVLHFPRDLLDASELEKIPNYRLKAYGTSELVIGRNSP